jgi:hypothetical protein
MSHEDIASTWLVLHGRQDIDHILRELIGRHVLDVSLGRSDSSHLHQAIVSHVQALKVIFDLQRTYLQSSVPSVECTSSLLPYELLLSVVLYLLDAIAAEFSSSTGLHVGETLKSLTAQTILSGLRALLLLRDDLPPREHMLLRSRFEEVYKHENTHSSDDLPILPLCRQVIRALGQSGQGSIYSKPACGMASLPDFFHNLVSFVRNQLGIHSF